MLALDPLDQTLAVDLQDIDSEALDRGFGGVDQQSSCRSLLWVSSIRPPPAPAAGHRVRRRTPIGPSPAAARSIRCPMVRGASQRQQPRLQAAWEAARIRPNPPARLDSRLGSCAGCRGPSRKRAQRPRLQPASRPRHRPHAPRRPAAHGLARPRPSTTSGRRTEKLSSRAPAGLHLANALGSYAGALRMQICRRLVRDLCCDHCHTNYPIAPSSPIPVVTTYPARLPPLLWRRSCGVPSREAKSAKIVPVKAVGRVSRSNRFAAGRRRAHPLPPKRPTWPPEAAIKRN